MRAERELADALRAPLDAGAADRVRARVIATRRAPRRRRRALVGGLAAIVAIAVAVIAWLVWPAPPQAFLLDGAPLGALRSLDEPRSFRLDDGTRVRLAARTSVDVLANHAHEVVLELRRGTIELDVQTSAERRVVIDAGLASVEVVGTRFAVTRIPDRVRVHVLRGRVDVRGEHVPGRLRRLIAGERIEVREDSRVEVPPSPPEPATPRAEPEDPPSLAPETPEQARRPRGRRETDEPSPSIDPEPPGVQELFDRADAARRAGRPREAIDALAHIVDEHPRDPRAGVAALSRARIELDVLDDPQEARRSLELALALGLPPALEEDARGRRVEALARAGQPERAREAGLAFFARWPNSRHATLVARFAGLERR